MSLDRLFDPIGIACLVLALFNVLGLFYLVRALRYQTDMTLDVMRHLVKRNISERDGK